MCCFKPLACDKLLQQTLETNTHPLQLLPTQLCFLSNLLLKNMCSKPLPPDLTGSKAFSQQIPPRSFKCDTSDAFWGSWAQPGQCEWFSEGFAGPWGEPGSHPGHRLPPSAQNQTHMSLNPALCVGRTRTSQGSAVAPKAPKAKLEQLITFQQHSRLSLSACYLADFCSQSRIYLPLSLAVLHPPSPRALHLKEGWKPAFQAALFSIAFTFPTWLG